MRAVLAGRVTARTAVRWAELVLVVVLAVELARLFWTIVTPAGAYGDWTRGRPTALPPAAAVALFRSYDPFGSPEAAAGGTAVTGLSLQLFGTRINEGSGLGSAIIAGADGVQTSYAVGEAVAPGVTLREVAFDHVVLDRGGARELLYLDQSGSPAADAPAPVAQAPVVPATTAAPTLASAAADIDFAPRGEGGRIVGIAVLPKGDGFARAGFQPGDVIVRVDGRPVGSLADMGAVRARLAAGGSLNLSVERGAATVPLVLNAAGVP